MSGWAEAFKLFYPAEDHKLQTTYRERLVWREQLSVPYRKDWLQRKWIRLTPYQTKVRPLP